MGLEDLLAHPQIWRGRGLRAAQGLPTGFAALDGFLPDGGWPRKALTEICVERYGIGELSLLMPALAALCREAAQAKRWIVWAAPPFMPYAPALSRHGIDLDCLLLVHPSHSAAGQRMADEHCEHAEVSWAVEQALRSGSSIAVLAWLGVVGDGILRRLQLAAEEYDCWTVLFRPFASLRQRSPAALRIGLSGPATRARIEIAKCRGMRPGVIELDLTGPRQEPDPPGVS